MWMVAAYGRITGWLGLRVGGQRTRTVVFCSKQEPCSECGSITCNDWKSGEIFNVLRVFIASFKAPPEHVFVSFKLKNS